MEKLYTISYSKMFDKRKAEIENVMFNGEKMNVMFCEDEKGIYAVACKYRKTAPRRACGHWHSGSSYYDVYFRKNFYNREQGNEFYKAVKLNKAI
jgi:hypothetical protein